MKTILYIVTINFLFLNLIYGQEKDSSFKKIETGNWLELSFRPLNEKGEKLAFHCVEEIPEFPGGYDSLAKFIIDTLKYPKAAKKDSVKGLVMTSFIVDKNGKVKNVEILKGVRNDLDSACIWAISILPNWTPPKSKYYENIEVQFVLPIRFILTKKEDE